MNFIVQTDLYLYVMNPIVEVYLIYSAYAIIIFEIYIYLCLKTCRKISHKSHTKRIPRVKSTESFS